MLDMVYNIAAALGIYLKKCAENSKQIKKTERKFAAALNANLKKSPVWNSYEVSDYIMF